MKKIIDYKSFLIERNFINDEDMILESLLLESNLIISDKFRSILYNIESPIASAILSIDNVDVDTDSNYIDTSDSNDLVTFVQDKKAQEMNKRAKIVNNARGYYNYPEIHDIIGAKESVKLENGTEGTIKATTKHLKYPNRTLVLFVADDGRESIINISGIEYIKSPWSNSRNNFKVGRMASKLSALGGHKPTAKETEQFVNKYKAEYDIQNNAFSRFRIVSGEDIRKYYSSKSYSEISGQLGNSCMRYDSCQPYLDIYVENDPKISLVILLSENDDDKITGRALLWTLDTPEGVLFMDRIYTINDSDVNLFIEYAIKNGYVYKQTQAVGTKDFMKNGESFPIDEMKLFVGKGREDFPYVDTLQYYSPYTGIISSETGQYTLTDTDGHYDEYDPCDYCSGDGVVECYDCDGSGRQTCNRCDGSGEIECYGCDGSGEVDVNCSTCDGSGEIEDPDDEDSTTECPDCDGSGTIRETCEECSGSGYDNCPDCDGSGDEECGTCEGNRLIDCHECR